MIERKGDITTVPNEGIQLIVHGCNGQGFMGFGVSGAIIKKWDQVFHNYYRWARESFPGIKPGNIQTVQVDTNIWVVNAITQEFYRGNFPKHKRATHVFVDYDAIVTVFTKVVEAALRRFPNQEVTINIPSIGTGLANGDWTIIEQLILSTVGDRCKLIHWEL